MTGPLDAERPHNNSRGWSGAEPTDRVQPTLYPVEKFGEFKIEKIAGSSHYHAWVEGAIASTKTTDGFHYAGPLAEAVQLGNVATRVPGQTLMWDAENLRVTNSEAATKLLTKAYREGWKLDAAS